MSPELQVDSVPLSHLRSPFDHILFGNMKTNGFSILTFYSLFPLQILLLSMLALALIFLSFFIK